MSGVPNHEIPLNTRPERSTSEAGRPRVLFLSHRFPYPAIGGDRIKSFHLLRHLAEIATVDLIALDEAGTATAENRNIISPFANTEVIPFDKRLGMRRVFRSLLGSTPIEFAYYTEPAMQREVDRTLATRHYDLIICFFLRTAGYVLDHEEAPKLLIAEDARVILQERASEEFSFSPEYFVRKIDASRLRTYEPRMMSSGFAKVTFVSKVDEARIRAAAPTLPTAIVSNGVDIQNYPFHGGEREDKLLFFGDLTVYHNIVMAKRLLKDIYPKIREVSPRTKLAIVGKSPVAELVALAENTPGAELHANVRDITPYLRSAKVFVHPQTVGAGIQNKLLEAMAAGIPVVTTPVGASGIAGLEDNVHALIRTTDQEIIEATLSLLKNDEKSLRLAKNARALIETRYTWEHVFETLDDVLHDIAPAHFRRAASTHAITQPEAAR